MTFEERGGPRKGRPDTDANQPESYPSPPHEVYMRYTLAGRIRWLERHRHWWIRDVREHQATCSWCPRCDGVAA